MSTYPQNTSGTTMDGVLAALIDIVGRLDALIVAVKANTQALAIGTGQSSEGGAASAPGYIDPQTGDVYMQQGAGS